MGAQLRARDALCALLGLPPAAMVPLPPAVPDLFLGAHSLDEVHHIVTSLLRGRAPEAHPLCPTPERQRRALAVCLMARSSPALAPRAALAHIDRLRGQHWAAAWPELRDAAVGGLMLAACGVGLIVLLRDAPGGPPARGSALAAQAGAQLPLRPPLAPDASMGLGLVLLAATLGLWLEQVRAAYRPKVARDRAVLQGLLARA